MNEELGQIKREIVAEEVERIVLPIPFELAHVNVWLLGPKDSRTLVDCGLDTRLTRNIWHSILADIQPGSIERIVVSHFHPDHVGLAGWLCEQCRAPLFTSAVCWAYTRLLRSESQNADIAAVVKYYTSLGVARSVVEQIGDGKAEYVKVVSEVPASFQRLSTGNNLVVGRRTWQVILGEGHAPEQVLLYDKERGLLLCGDQILPDITPNISVWAHQPADDPLADFLSTLSVLYELPDQTMLLPAHGQPFFGLQKRIDLYREHHRQRLAIVESGCKELRSVLELVPIVFPQQLSQFDLIFALGEIMAHCRYLVELGRLRMKSGEDGVLLFQR